MNIAYVTNYYKPAYVYGGPTRSIAALCEGLTQLGHRVTVYTTNANGDEVVPGRLHEPELVHGVRVIRHRVHRFPLASFFFSPDLSRHCRRALPSFDLAVLDLLWTYSFRACAMACRRADVPYIVPLRGGLLPWALNQRPLRKKVYLAAGGREWLSAAAALQCTDVTEADAAMKLGLGAPVLVVPNGLNVEDQEIRTGSGDVRRTFGIPAKGTLLVFAGRLHRKKRPDVAIAALAAAVAAGHDAHLVVAGSDEESMAPALLAEAVRRGIGSRVHIVGLLAPARLAALLAESDLFVMPSEPGSENFGMSAAEALAAGVPVLTSDGVPVGRWAEERGAGRQVSGSREAFALAACEMLANRDQLRAMGKVGSCVARESFDWLAVAGRAAGEYESIINWRFR